MNELVQGSVLVDVATDSHFYHATCALVYGLCGLLSVFHVGIYVFLSCVFIVNVFHCFMLFSIFKYALNVMIRGHGPSMPERRGSLNGRAPQYLAVHCVPLSIARDISVPSPT